MFQLTQTKLIVAFAAAITAIALLSPAAQAKEPNPGYEQFAGCPSPEENPASGFCVTSTITGGHFKMGSKDVPIKNPITLSGGVNVETGDFIYNSKGGLSPVKQTVPGGIIGLTGLDWLVEFLSVEQLKLYAVTELAGTPSNPLEEPLTLPLKVHLINPVLGNNCHVGSNSDPITLNLITKTTSPPPPNEPISGVEPEQSTDELGIIHQNNGTYVDNSFSAPGANGCVLTLFGFIPVSLNSLVNSVSGLPAAAGTNEAVQEFDAEAAFAFLVY